MGVLLGTSGWQYRDWRGRFYPPAGRGGAEGTPAGHGATEGTPGGRRGAESTPGGHGAAGGTPGGAAGRGSLPQREWLAFYAERFATVEVNNAFYRLPERETFARWQAATPQDFCLAVKISRYLTHIRRLREPAEPVARFLDRATGLGGKLGPVLLQLPPTLAADTDLLTGVLSRFPAGVRVAVEPRHPSWWTAAVRSTLERHGAALCWADRRGRPVTPLWRTADFGYLRMHEGRADPRPRYGRQALTSWLERIAGEFDRASPVFVYFNNDPGAAAIADAAALAAQAHRRGWPVTRAPSPRLFSP